MCKFVTVALLLWLLCPTRCLFPSCTFWILCNFLLLFIFCQVCLLVKETAEIETGMAEKSCWNQANNRQKLGLVWRNRKKISQIIKDYFYLPLFLLIILGSGLSGRVVHFKQFIMCWKCGVRWLTLTHIVNAAVNWLYRA